ncbi:phosphoesterase PA-phosphatase [Arthrobacter glacialis]|uniref:Phosphoesterase PA-phosphatase n=1 Tax=Arthrobacter glacialis TaxID=1664 RepID=A0A2S3ZU49_ARTGL|nr:phosphoesterase PA-phosphatase [Arthrobacter glacialis]
MIVSHQHRSAAPYPWGYFRSWWWLLVGALGFAITAAAGLAIKGSGPKIAELGVDTAMAHDRNPALTALSLAIHYGLGPAGAVIIVLLSCLILTVARRNLASTLTFASVVSIGWLSSELGKRIVERIRPPADTVQALIPEHGMDSFPSGHTAFAVALVWAFVLVVARTPRAKAVTTIVGTVLVAVVAFTRVYLGVHYPSDVIASVFIASAAILAWLPVWDNLIAHRLGNHTRAPDSLPGRPNPAERHTAKDRR